MHLSAVSTKARRVSDLLELELEVVVSDQTWRLGTEFRSSIRAVSVLNL